MPTKPCRAKASHGGDRGILPPENSCNSTVGADVNAALILGALTGGVSGQLSSWWIWISTGTVTRASGTSNTESCPPGIETGELMTNPWIAPAGKAAAPANAAGAPALVPRGQIGAAVR